MTVTVPVPGDHWHASDSVMTVTHDPSHSSHRAVTQWESWATARSAQTKSLVVMAYGRCSDTATGRFQVVVPGRPRMTCFARLKLINLNSKSWRRESSYDAPCIRIAHFIDLLYFLDSLNRFLTFVIPYLQFVDVTGSQMRGTSI
jgi:hypothetical protein